MAPRKRNRRLPVIVVLLLGMLLGPYYCAAAGDPAAAPASRPATPTLSVFAAASLQDALRELAPLWQKETGGTLEFNFGSSSDLARQIVAAPRADVFFSADEAWMDHVQKAGLLDAGSRRLLLSNRLVVVAPADSQLKVASAADLAAPAIRRLALASPDSVPAGKYAKAWLEKSGVWESVKDRVIPALDVRACLASVESDNVDAGLVYRSDTMIGKKSRVLLEVSGENAPRISYPVAAISGRPSLEMARRFVTWLAAERAVKVFERFGFLTVITGAGPETRSGLQTSTPVETGTRTQTDGRAETGVHP